MTRRSSMPTAFAAVLLAAGSLQAQPAPARPAPSGARAVAPPFAGRTAAPSPDRISLLTVENHLPEVAGRYIAMPATYVASVESARLFTVGGLLFPSYDMDEDERTLVLLASPAPNLSRGALVEVTGWVTTLATARQVFPDDWGVKPDDDAFQDGNRAVIVANIVRAVDGTEIASRP